MNPIAEDYIDELSASEIFALAHARFEKLRALNPEESVRKGLRESGVSEHRIRALYPFDFADIAALVQPDVSSSGLGELASTTAPKLVRLSNALGNITESLSLELKLQLDEYGQHASSALVAEFKAHVLAQLPAVNEYREIVAGIVAFTMGYSVSLMEHLELVEHGAGSSTTLRRNIGELLLRVTDLLLPQMRMEEIAEREAAVRKILVVR